MSEKWKWVPGYKDRYEVSDQGRVRSYVRTNAFSNPKGEIVKSFPNYAGYHVVNLRSAAGDTTQHKVHRLVLEAFRGAAPAGTEGAHHDDNKNNNALSNLAWKTPKANARDKVKNS